MPEISEGNFMPALSCRYLNRGIEVWTARATICVEPLFYWNNGQMDECLAYDFIYEFDSP
jgi:hypothetical protein